MTKRIWELDALRGISILGMVALHLLFDLNVALPLSLKLLQDWGGYIFLVLSGICVTLGHRPVRRGLVVLGCGMLCTLVTWGMYALKLTSNQMVIWFGVLHCLGICMLLWPVFQNLSSLILSLLAAFSIVFGTFFESLLVSFPWLVPLGIRFADFASADYFPLLPNLGFFLLGAVVGRKLYSKKQSLFPNIRPNRFLCFCGRHSLAIYLLHQPILYGVLWVISQF
jgi:uncharacterized membrane protein